MSEDSPIPDEPADPIVDDSSQTGAPVGQSGKPALSRQLLWLLIWPGLLLLVAIRRWIGLRYRRERCSKGHPNRRSLTWWRWLMQLSKAQNRTVPEDLLCLAEKARFSQHTMTEEEIAQLQQAVETQIANLKTLPLKRRLWCKYGLVLY